MQPQSSMARVSLRSSDSDQPEYTTITIIQGRVTLDGFGIRLSIQRGHLVLEDGIGEQRRTATFHRATCGLTHISIIGHTGSLSLDVLRWLSDVGASLIVLDKDGVVLLAHGPRGRDDGRIRRAQAIAPYTGAHLPIIRLLLKRKLEGQSENLARFAPESLSATTIAAMLGALETADSPDVMRGYEANAAVAYWDSLASMPVTFGRREVVPDHWRTFGGRASALTGNPRRATNPVNALLNYAYAVLEAEASIALVAVGLDPALGVLHADLPSRDSLACDVMEAVRPDVDSFIFSQVARHTFQARDFHETREGGCRLVPPLTGQISTTGATWKRLLAPIVEQVAQRFMDAGLPINSLAIPAKGKRRTPRQELLPTLLTQSKRSAGRDAIRKQPATTAAMPKPMLPPTCARCGVPLPASGRKLCDVCLPEHADEVLESWKNAGPKAAVGTNHGGEVGIKRGRTNATHQAAIQAWERDHSSAYDPADFTTRILPGIQGVPVRTLAKATGLTNMYCLLVRRGDRVPHPIHWEALAQVEKAAKS